MTHDPTKLADELLPCPFCGAAMHLDYDVKNGMFGPEGDHAPGCFIGTIDFRDFADEHQAANEWNRRPTPPPDVAKLREAMTAYVKIAEERPQRAHWTGRYCEAREKLIAAALASQDAPSAPPCGTKPGLDFTLSDEAKAKIAAIEDNARMAPHRVRDVVLSASAPPSDDVERTKRAVIETFPWLTDGDAEIAARAAIAALQETKP